jgi:hypothetical protein
MSTDRAYQNAIDRRRTLLQELEKVDSFLKLYKEFAGGAAPRISPEASQSTPADSSMESEESAGDIMSQMAFEKIVREILLDKGHPLTRGALVREFDELGIKLIAADREKYVGTKLWRARDKIFNVPGKGYWLRDTASAAIGYDPADTTIRGFSYGHGRDDDDDLVPPGQRLPFDP